MGKHFVCCLSLARADERCLFQIRSPPARRCIMTVPADYATFCTKTKKKWISNQPKNQGNIFYSLSLFRTSYIFRSYRDPFVSKECRLRPQRERKVKKRISSSSLFIYVAEREWQISGSFAKFIQPSSSSESYTRSEKELDVCVFPIFSPSFRF